MGAFGQCLVLLRDDIGALPDDVAVETLADMEKQVLKFFVNEVKNQN